MTNLRDDAGRRGQAAIGQPPPSPSGRRITKSPRAGATRRQARAARSRSWRLSAAVLVPVLAIAAIGAPAPVGAAQQSVDALTAQVNEHLRAYEYEAALAAAERAVAMSPFDVDANAALRTVHSRLGTMATLTSRYRQLLQQYPGSAAATYLLSTAFSGEMSEAYLLEALRLDPNYGPAVRSMASRTARNRRDPAGLEWARRAMELMPGDYSAISSYVTALQRHGNDQEALAVLQQMTALYPNDLRHWTALWRAQMRRLERNDAALGPLLAQINAQRFRFMGSMVDMELFAGVLGGGGDAGRAMAVDVWLDIARRWPEHPRAQRALLQAAGRAPEIDQRIEILEQLIELYPESPAIFGAWQTIIQQLIGSDRFDEAIDVARTVIDLPDPGFEETGIGRDASVRNTDWGFSLACVGHLGWFTAAQATIDRPRRVRIMASPDGSGMVASLRSESGESIVFISPDGSPVLRELEAVASVITPQAAAAAQSLLASSCEEPPVLMNVGMQIVGSPVYRGLATRLIERAIVVPTDGAHASVARERNWDRQLQTAHAMLADLYLEAGRIHDALRLADEIEAGVGAGSTPQRATFFTLARIYEAGGRIDAAKAYYLRSSSTSRTGREAEEQLARLYRARSSRELVRADPARATRVAPRSIQLRRHDIDVRADLGRFLGDGLTLVGIWAPDFAPSRELLAPFAELAANLEGNVSTLTIAASRTPTGAGRSLRRNPPPGRFLMADFDEIEELGVTELPTTLLIDAEGRILARQMSFEVAPDRWLEEWTAVIEEELGRRQQEGDTALLKSSDDTRQTAAPNRQR